MQSLWSYDRAMYLFDQHLIKYIKNMYNSPHLSFQHNHKLIKLNRLGIISNIQHMATMEVQIQHGVCQQPTAKWKSTGLLQNPSAVITCVGTKTESVGNDRNSV